MDNQCPTCQRPYGKRRRCYYCQGKKRSGETRKCAQCGKEFYAARWQLADTERRQGTYCSKECLYDAQRLDGTGWQYRRKDGYIAVYYPRHPDASKSGWMLQHRLVAEEAIGRRLLPKEHVHHLNGIKDDNRPENLQVLNTGDHTRITLAARVARERAERAELAEYRRRYGPLEG